MGPGLALVDQLVGVDDVVLDDGPEIEVEAVGDPVLEFSEGEIAEVLDDRETEVAGLGLEDDDPLVLGAPLVCTVPLT